MVQTRILMGMPIVVNVEDPHLSEKWFNQVYDFFDYVDHKFSVFKKDSEVSMLNAKKLNTKNASRNMKLILKLCDQTKNETWGYFDAYRAGKLNPSGLVKGWAIYEASKIIGRLGAKIFFIDAGGDVQAVGKSWKIGIRNPFNSTQIVKTVEIKDRGIATSGTYIRGQHIYNPHDPKPEITDIVSLTVIGPNVYEADRMATAAFAMGREGINFIAGLKDFSGYMIDKNGQAIYTPNFSS